MKIFEKIVHDQVSVFVKENSYLGNLALESFFLPPQLF